MPPVLQFKDPTRHRPICDANLHQVGRALWYLSHDIPLTASGSCCEDADLEAAVPTLGMGGADNSCRQPVAYTSQNRPRCLGLTTLAKNQTVKRGRTTLSE